MNKNGNVTYGIRICQKKEINFEISKTSFLYKIWICFQNFCLKFIPFVKSPSVKIQNEINKQFESVTSDKLKLATKIKLTELKDVLATFEKNIQKKAPLITRLFGCTLSFQTHEKTIVLLKDRLIKEIKCKNDIPEDNKTSDQRAESCNDEKKDNFKKIISNLKKVPTEIINKISGYLKFEEFAYFALAFKCKRSFKEWLNRSGFYDSFTYNHIFKEQHTQLVCQENLTEDVLGKIYELYVENFLSHSKKIEALKFRGNEGIPACKFNEMFKKNGKKFPNAKRLSITLRSTIKGLSVGDYFEETKPEIPNQMMIEFANNIISNCPNLKIIDIYSRQTDIHQLFIKKLKKLEHIVFKNRENLNEIIINLINEKETLKSICLENNPPFTEKELKEYVNDLGSIKILMNNPNGKGTFNYKNSIILPCDKWVDELLNLKGLQKIKFVSKGYFPNDVDLNINYALYLKKLPFLEEITFLWVRLNTFKLQSLQEILSLKTLSISNIKLDISSVKILASFSSLKKLKLDFSVIHSILSIFNSTNLESLDIKCDNINYDEVLVGVKVCKNLKVLKINYKKISNSEEKTRKEKFREAIFQIRPDLAVFV